MPTSRSDTWIKFFIQNGLGRFDIRSYRGGGGFGLVFEASDTDSGTPVALKILKPNARGNEVLEFEDEGRMLRKLTKATNVLSLVGETGEEFVDLNTASGLSVPMGVRYHVLELADGSLDELLIDDFRRAQLSWAERLRLWRGAVKGIHQMHIKGCFHRDIKSENYLLFLEPRNVTTCKVGDLGRARDMARAARLFAEDYLAGCGDLRFAAPEGLLLQQGSDRDAFQAADLYGLGSLLFEFGTGQGITGIALGDGRDIFNYSWNNRSNNVQVDLAILRSKYNQAISLLEPELPPAIRHRASALVRQLCDPVPEMRFPPIGLGRRLRSSGLEWLIRHADIMVRQMNASPGQGNRVRIGGGAR